MSIISTVKTAALAVKTFGVQNAPIIFAGCAIIGAIGVGITAWRGALKARDIIETETRKKGESLTKGEKVKVTWKAWVPPLTILGLTVISMGASYYIHSVRLAQATAAATMLMTHSKDLEKQLDEIAEKAPEIVKDSEVKKLEHELSITDDNGCDTFYDTGLGTWLYYDSFRHFKFRSSPDYVAGAISKFQSDYEKAAKHYRAIPLNKFYEYLKIPKCDAGDWLGYYAMCDIDKYDGPDIKLKCVPNAFGDEDCYVIEYVPTAFMNDTYTNDDDLYEKFGSYRGM